MKGLLLAAFGLLGSLAVVACGGAADKTPPPGTGATATVAPTPVESKEVTLVKSVRPILANTVSALQKGDIAAAKAAWALYDGAWNGIEVYINFRSLPTYQDIETNWQAKINQAFAGAQPKAAEILPLAQAMLAKYDEAIQIVQSGPAISPLFDDVADLRIARAPLRQVAPALASGDLAAAKVSFNAFAQAWPKVSALIKLRSEDAYQETTQSVAQVNAAWQKAPPVTAELTPLVAAVTARFNYGLNLVTTAARKADLAKTTYSDADLRAARGIKDIQAELRKSLASWNAGKYQDAGDQARRAGSDLFTTGAVLTPLKAQALDVAFKAALDAYAALAGAAGDAAKVAAANKAALEAGEVALQGVAGQFWADPKLQAAVAGRS